MTFNLIFLLILFAVPYSYSQNNAGVSRYRPCPNFDRICVGQHLARNSYCRVTDGRNVREPITAPIRQLEFPYFNVTLERFDVDYYNVLSGNIEEFFVDYASGYTVLSVDFRNLTLSVGQSRYETNRRANIPFIDLTPTDLSYPEVAITVVFSSTRQLNLANARSTAYNMGIPTVKTDIPRSSSVQQLISDTSNIAGAESFITTAPIIARSYIQAVLCDFGISPNGLGIDN